MKVISTISVDPKTIFELKTTLKIARNCPKRFKMTQKLKETENRKILQNESYQSI